jgi:hypothetical protein
MSEDQPLPTENATPEESLFQHYRLVLDGPSLRRQRMLLQQIAADPRLSDAERGDADGLVNLTNALAEQAYDEYGIDASLGDPVGALYDYVRRRNIPLEIIDTSVTEGLQQMAAAAQQQSPQNQLQLLISAVGNDNARRLIDTALAIANTPQQAEPVAEPTPDTPPATEPT